MNKMAAMLGGELPLAIEDKDLVTLDLPGCTIQRQRGFIAQSAHEKILNRLIETIEWEQRDVVVSGNTYKQPRLVAWHGTRAYTYAGLTLEPKPLTRLLKSLQDKIEETLKTEFNSVLLNRYVGGQYHGMGHHSDNEPELGPQPVIAMLTFGEGRFLEFKPKNWLISKHPAAKPTRVETPAGSLLVMRGLTQKNWTHGIPKVRWGGDRITLTFRTIL